jgi:hypothetical protein
MLDQKVSLSSSEVQSEVLPFVFPPEPAVISIPRFIILAKSGGVTDVFEKRRKVC